MADAKSRYEIVESLTDKRTEVIEEIGSMKDSINQREQQLDQLKRNQKRAVEELERNQAMELEDTVASNETYVKSVNERVASLEQKKDALTEAIEALKSISSNNEKA